MTPGELYRARSQQQALSKDVRQEQTLQHFNRLAQTLNAAVKPRYFWQRWLHKNPAPVGGLYLWGGVGRGKTLLMDTFYESLPFSEKKRVHFHNFMRIVHAQLKQFKSLSDPLQHVARNLAAQYRVLCLDEFIVTDITDAMLLSGLLTTLSELGVCVVTTSNTEPEELYKNGLQRARFLPAIELIKQHMQIIHLDNNIDYRLLTLRREGTYHHPLNEHTRHQMQLTFENLAGTSLARSGDIEINQRPIPYVTAADGIIWFDFQTLCNSPRSQNDYIEIASQYHSLLLSDVPQMDDLADDAARRFLNLIDILYDHKVKLIVSADVSINELYKGKRLVAEFQRATSRLIEMQSEQYLAKGHLS